MKTKKKHKLYFFQGVPVSPKTKGKKSFQPYVASKDEEETSDVASESSHVPVAAVLPTTKEIVSP